MQDDREHHYVMITDRGEVHVQGDYTSYKSAENRMNNVQGGDAVDIWSTYEGNPDLAKAEFRARER